MLDWFIADSRVDSPYAVLWIILLAVVLIAFIYRTVEYVSKFPDTKYIVMVIWIVSIILSVVFCGQGYKLLFVTQGGSP